MSQIGVPSSEIQIIDPGSAGFGTPPVVGSPLGGAGSAAQDIGTAVFRLAAGVRAAQRSRQVAEQTTAYMRKVWEAQTAAEEADPLQAEQMFIQSMDGLRESVGEIDDGIVQREVADRVERLILSSEKQFKDTLVRKEIAEGVAALESNAAALTEGIATGRIGFDDAISQQHSIITAQQEAGLLDAEQASDARFQASRRFVLTQYDALLRTDPGSAAIFMQEPIARETLSADEIRLREKKAEETLEDHWETEADESLRGYIDQLRTGISQDIDTLDGAAWVADAVQLSEDLATLPHNEDNKITAADIRFAGLRDEAELAARTGDTDRFALIQQAMPDTANAQAFMAMWANRLTTAEQGLSAQAEALITVDKAIENRWTVDSSSKLVRQMLDMRAREMVTAMADAGATKSEIFDAVVERFGPTGLLPSGTVKEAESVIRTLDTRGEDEIRDSLAFMSRVKSAFPHTYERQFDGDTRAFLRRFRELELPGNPAQQTAQQVRDSFQREDAIDAVILNRKRPQALALFESKFVEIAEDELDLDLAADRGVRIAGEEDEVPRIAFGAITTRLPAEMLSKYLSIAENAWRDGMEPEAAAAFAWESVSPSYGISGTFQSEPKLMRDAPEKAVRTGEYAESATIETDIVHALVRDAAAHKVLMPGSEDLQLMLPLGNEEGMRRAFRDRLMVRPSRTAAIAGPNGKRLPLYQLFVRSENGAIEPVMIERDGVREPYLIDLRQTEGLSFELEAQQRHKEAERLRREALPSERKRLIEQQREWFRKQRSFK